MECTQDNEELIKSLSKCLNNLANALMRLANDLLIKFYEYRDKLKRKAKYEKRVRNRQKLHNKNRKRGKRKK